jgi:NitT/TauT family transport system substrate-binding protein
MKKFSIFSIIGIMLIIVQVGLFAAGSQDTDQKENPREPIELKIASLKGPTGFGMIKLFEDVPDLGPGVSSTYFVIPTPIEMVARITSGEVDFAVLPANVGAKLYTKGPGYPLGAVVGLGSIYILSRDEGIKTLKDLSGRQVYGVGKGATPDYLMRYFIREGGIEGVNIDFSLPPTQVAQMAIAGKADTVILPEPFVTQILMKAPDMKIVIDLQDQWKNISGEEEVYPISVVVIRPEVALNYPEVVARFLEEYKASIEFVVTHPAPASVLIEKFGIMPAVIAEKAIPRCNLSFASALASRESMEVYLSVLLAGDPVSIGGELPDSNYYFSAP